MNEEKTSDTDSQIVADGKRHRQEEKEFIANSQKTAKVANDDGISPLQVFLNEIIGAHLRHEPNKQHQHEREER